MLRHRILTYVIAITVSLSELLLLPEKSTAQSFNFVSVDVPCAACPGGVARRTTVGGINPAGDIVGAFTDAVGAQHGFLLSQGQFTRSMFPELYRPPQQE